MILDGDRVFGRCRHGKWGERESHGQKEDSESLHVTVAIVGISLKTNDNDS
jgi:hypothetical protein